MTALWCAWDHELIYLLSENEAPGFKWVFRPDLNHITPVLYACMHIHVHTYRCHDLHVCVLLADMFCVWAGVAMPVCVYVPSSSPPPAAPCMSRPQPLQWGYVSVLIPPSHRYKCDRIQRGNHMALCVPDLCTGLLSTLTVKPTQVLWHQLQRGPSTVHLKLNTAR